MQYTPIILGGMGVMGVLLHNLVKMDTINRANEGKVDFLKYFMIERFSIIISIIVIIACVIASQEIRQLFIAGKWLGIGFLCIGYMAQSLLVKLMSMAKNKLNNKTKNTEI